MEKLNTNAAESFLINQNCCHLLGCVLYIGRGVVRQAGRGVPVLRGSGQVLSDEPVEFRPTFELDHLPGSILWQTFEAGFRGES